MPSGSDSFDGAAVTGRGAAGTCCTMIGPKLLPSRVTPRNPHLHRAAARTPLRRATARNPLRRVAAALACVLAFLAHQSIASACQCNRPQPVADEAAAAELIFVAEPITLGGGTPKMKVQRVYKGSVPRETTVHVSDCVSVVDTLAHDAAKAREKGGAILFYGYRGGDQILPTMCGRSAFVSDAAADLAYLDATFPAPRDANAPTASPAAAPDSAASSAPAASTAPAASNRDAAPEPATSVPKTARPASGCGCGIADTAFDASTRAWSLVLFAGALALARRRRR